MLGYSQVGKAPDSDSGERRFESYYPSHFLCEELAYGSKYSKTIGK